MEISTPRQKVKLSILIRGQVDILLPLILFLDYMTLTLVLLNKVDVIQPNILVSLIQICWKLQRYVHKGSRRFHFTRLLAMLFIWKRCMTKSSFLGKCKQKTELLASFAPCRKHFDNFLFKYINRFFTSFQHKKNLKSIESWRNFCK